MKLSSAVTPSSRRNGGIGSSSGNSKKPEQAILADPDRWYGGTAEAMGADAYRDYQAAIHDPATVHGMVEDYRAGLGIDRTHDEVDRRESRRVECPTMILWSLRDDLELLYGDVLGVWNHGQHNVVVGSTVGITWRRKCPPSSREK
ncbi:hypothetical protein [Pseudomonas hormoni]